MKDQATIVDYTQEEKKQNSKPVQPNVSTVSLSKKEYSNVIKAAYKEGIKEAINEFRDGQEKLTDTAKTKQSETDDSSDNTTQHPKGKRDGEEEAHREEAKKREQTKYKLENIAERHDIELLRAHAVFPFDIFPDMIAIDTTKVTIVRKQMFATESIITIPLKDVADAHVQTALFLASVCIAYMPHSTSPGMLHPEEETVSCLKRADAIRIKNILKGVLIATAEDIDLAKLSPEDVVEIVEKFGHSEGVE